jgi:hypothetical protein
MGRVESLLPCPKYQFNPNQISPMSNNKTMLSVGAITVGEIVLPTYQFSQTEYAFPLHTILQFLKLENHHFPQEPEFFIAINTQTGSPEKFISIETLVKFLIDLSRKKHHSQAMAILQSLAIHGFELYLQNHSDTVSDSDFQGQLISKTSDSDRFSTELQLNTNEAFETELLDLDHLQKIRERNRNLVNLLDEWNVNPDYELDRTWNEVMANL